MNQALLWIPRIGAGLILASAVWSWAHPLPEPPETSPQSVDSVPSLGNPDRTAPNLDPIRGENPFRLARRPALVGYGEVPPPHPEDQGLPPAASVPSVWISGVIGGPPWRIILEGAPGWASGLVLDENEVIEGYALVEVRADSVSVAVGDTVLVLPKRGNQ